MSIFDYRISPDSLPVGGPGGTQTAVLTVTVTNNTGKDQVCPKIEFIFPPQLGGKILAASLSATWAIPASGPFTAHPQTPATGIPNDTSVSFKFTGVVPATTPGAATIEATEQPDPTAPAAITVELTSPGLGITEFSADTLYVGPGDTVTFSWATLDADSVMLTWGDSQYPGEGSGQFPVTLQETVTATLTAIKDGAPKPYPTAQLTVMVHRPTIYPFDASPQPAKVPKGGPLELTWGTLHATECTLVFYPGGTGAARLGAVDPISVPTTATAYPVYPEVSGSYELSAIAPSGGIPAQRDVTVESVVADLTATPNAICPGGSSTLKWSTDWAVGPTITPDGKPVDRAGERPVSPTAETVYTLNAPGQDPQTRTASVAIFPVISQLTAVVAYQQFTLAWVTSGAKSIEVSGQSRPFKDADQVVLTEGQEHSSWRDGLTLTLTSAFGAVASVQVQGTENNPLPTMGEEGTWWSGSAGVVLSAPSGINCPGSVALSWNNAIWGVQTSLGGSATNAVGATVPLSASPSTATLDVVAAPAAATDLWSGSLADSAGCLTLSWTVALNAPPVPPG